MQNVTESPEAAYRAALEAGRFQIQRCGGCERHVFPPRIACPDCGALDLTWTKARGTGTVHSCTVVNRKPDRGGPYNVVLVDLAEGVRMMSHVKGFGGEEVPLDLAVRAEIEPESHRLVFRAEDPA